MSELGGWLPTVDFKSYFESVSGQPSERWLDMHFPHTYKTGRPGRRLVSPIGRLIKRAKLQSAVAVNHDAIVWHRLRNGIETFFRQLDRKRGRRAE